MPPVLTGNLDGVLHSLLGLYGSGQPTTANSASLTSGVAGTNSFGGGLGKYTETSGMQAAVAESHTNRDSLVHKAVGQLGDGTVAGRSQLTNQIADLQSRVRAIAAIGDSRFTGPALLDAARDTITSATRQVDADVAAAQQQ